MAESYTAAQQDVRTFGQQIARLLDDLNRPDLQAQATEYLQDAMRFWARKPFFFNETDNTTVPTWAAATNYPQGSTIQFTTGGVSYVIVALNTGLSGALIPAFTTTLFTAPGGGTNFPPPTSGTAGTTDDNGGPPAGIRWATVATPFQQNLYTQLSTVYNINQYVPPLDYVAPKLVEVTASNLRYPLTKLSYAELRSYDIIRPAPITVYPTFWAYFQNQIYVWPYPNGFYPLTLSYRSAPPVLTNANDTNFWTTNAERLIRKYAQAALEREVEHDAQAAAESDKQWSQELSQLKIQQIAQHSTGGIPPSSW